MAGKRIYLDYNATTPADPRVVDAMLPFFTEMFGNASSDHVFGWDSGEAVEHSREQLAGLVNCRPSELSFNSGATEGANLALFGYCEAHRSRGNHIITCRTEHKAILDTMHALEKRNFEVTYLDVDREGNINLRELEAHITSKTILVCLMLANNETGLLHPMQEIEKIVHAKDVRLMSDITQAVGKVPVDLRALNLDLAIFSSHKIYGPKGIGALYTNKSKVLSLEPHLHGGGQEKGLRPGTLNVPGIVGFGKAAELASSEMACEASSHLQLKEMLETELEAMQGAIINSRGSDRLPNTTNISFKGVDGTQLLRRMSSLAISRGSACTSNTLQPSHVLKAMGLSDELALSSFRISLGRGNSYEDIETVVKEIKRTMEQLKGAMV